MRLLVVCLFVAAAVPQDRQGQFQLKRITIPYASPDGESTWTLSAGSAKGDRNKGTLQLFDITLLVEEKDRRRLQMSASRATVSDKLTRITATGEVKTELLPSGTKFSGEVAAYNWTSKNYLCTGEVKITIRKARLAGDRLEGNSVNGRFTLR